LLTKTGTIVMVGGEGDNRWTSGFGRTVRAALISPFIKQNIVMFLASEQHEDLVRLAELVEQGAVTPQLDQVLPLEQAPAAMELLEKGQIRGKVALAVQN
jgi:NADPH:quinone reductase-like Zn-dependent oxidoreductase